MAFCPIVLCPSLQLQSTLSEVENRSAALNELKSSITVNDDVYAKLVSLRQEAEKDVEALSDMLKGLVGGQYFLLGFELELLSEDA